jgi:hypothetical protein
MTSEKFFCAMRKEVDMSEEELSGRLLHAEQKIRSAKRAVLLLFTVLLALFIWQAWALHRLANPHTLTLRRLNIVDEHGVVRVILAAPAPEPMILGNKHHRDGPVSGLIIADATGTERGGYVTSDGDYANALLTLDGQGLTLDGHDSQTVLLLAEPNGDTLFRIWNRDKGSLTMGVADNPFLNEHQKGNLIFSSPLDNPQTRDTRPLFK